MFLLAISPLDSIARIGGRGIGWLGFWSLRRGSGRRRNASSAWPSFVGPAVLCVPAAAGGGARGWRAVPGGATAAPAPGREAGAGGTGVIRPRPDFVSGVLAA